MTMIDVDRRAKLRDDFQLFFTPRTDLPSRSIPKGCSIKPALDDLTARRNPICKYFSHLSVEINDGRRKLASLCRIHRDFATAVYIWGI